ncbi:MAG: lysylphosphatidylglycerol synthase transmembrane domain-containing protein [Candidatus Saccharimonadales bacterium]
MAEVSFLKRRWKLILNIVTLVALVVLIYLIRHQLVQTLHNLTQINAWALLLIIPVEILNYDSQARLYRSLFKIVGSKLSYRSMYETSLELNFVNHVFPSGGVTGISYFGVKMRNKQITASKATVVQLFKLVLLFLSFEVILVFGLFFLSLGHHVNNLTILIAGSFSTLLVIVTAAFAFVIGSRSRIAGFFTFITVILNKLLHVVRPNHPETFNIKRAREIFDDLHENYALIQTNWRALKKPFLWALMANVWEVAAVYVVYIAFGQYVNVGAVILAYAVANFAGLVSVLPGGVGVYEALMTGVLVAAGVPARVSLPVTVMYRVVNTVVQLPFGYFYYHRTLQGRSVKELTADVG